MVLVLALAATPALADKADDAFYNQSKYTFCDAKMLSGQWRQSMADTKARIGQKILAGRDALKYLDGELGHARDHARKDAASRCTITDINLSYDDIAAVAAAWNDTPADVKTLIENKVMSGMEAQAVQLVRKVAEQQRNTHAADESRGIEAFLAQDRYQYCDAKLIGALWKKDPGDGKAWIGDMVLAKTPQLIERKLVLARADVAKHAENRCTFDEVGFEYDDAVRLAKAWKVDVDKSKAMIATQVMNGHRADVVAALQRAK